MTTPLDILTRHYLIAALWSSTDDNGDPLDDHCDLDDIHPDSVASARATCAAFLASAGELLAQLPDTYGAHPDCGNVHPQMAAAGHDLWLTSHHHGAGFWDRGLGELGDKLTRLAYDAVECDAYIGDDARVHLS